MKRNNVFNDITIGELLEIKKILKLSLADGLPEMNKLKEKYMLTDIQTRNLLCLAKNFDFKTMIKE